MKTITINSLSIRFKADELTDGTYAEQARHALERINRALEHYNLIKAMSARVLGEDELMRCQIDVLNEDGTTDEEDGPELT